MTEVLMLAGPAGVGKTTTAHEIGAQLRAAEVPHVILDSDELDRVWPLSEADQLSLNRANLAAFWGNAARLGHTRLVLVGVFVSLEAERAWIVDALGGASVISVVLRASDPELERRLRAREIGSGFSSQLARTRQQAEFYRRLPSVPGEVIDVDGQSVPDVAGMALARTGWLGQARR